MAIKIKCKTPYEKPETSEDAKVLVKRKPHDAYSDGALIPEVELQIERAAKWIKANYSSSSATYPYENGDIGQRALNIYEAYQEWKNGTDDVDLTCGESNGFAQICLDVYSATTTVAPLTFASEAERDEAFQKECDSIDWDSLSDEEAHEMKEYLDRKYFS